MSPELIATGGVCALILAGGRSRRMGADKPLLEVHLLDFHGDLYGQTFTVEFIHRLRDIVRFDSSEALQRQLQEDIKQTRLWS